jgi:hypothetical protein
VFLSIPGRNSVMISRWNPIVGSETESDAPLEDVIVSGKCSHCAHTRF